MTSQAQSLERRAVSLGTANAVDYALQFLLPIVLTRALDAEAFGQYRLLWLAVGTLVAIAPFFMPQSLYYFLPRSDRATQRLYINQTLVFLAGVGLVAAWALSAWNPFLPGAFSSLVAGDFPLVPAFVLLWSVAILLDVLPTVDERVGWQAKAIVGLSVTRTVALSAAAILTGRLEPVLWTLLAFALVKLGLLVYYVASTHGLAGPVLRPREFAGQVKHAAPFGLSGTFYGMRGQADQWVAAALFPVTMFASFSIAAVLGPLVNLFRQSVNHVFLPSMSRSHSSGDAQSMLALNSRANAMVALLVYPLLAFAFVFAEAVITLVYTATYVEAAPVLRVYVVALVAFVIELNSIMLLLKQGGFAARVNAAALVLSVAMSYGGALAWGLPGAAIGSVAMIYVERGVSLARISRLTGFGISKLQDWNRLGAILAASAAAAALAALLTHAWTLAPIASLFAGALAMALAYPAAVCLFGQRTALTGFFNAFGPQAAPAATLDQGAPP